MNVHKPNNFQSFTIICLILSSIFFAFNKVNASETSLETTNKLQETLKTTKINGEDETLRAVSGTNINKISNDKPETLNIKEDSCDNINCNYEELTLEEFTGYQIAVCQNKPEFDIVRSAKTNSEELCNEDLVCYIIRTANYESKMVKACDSGFDVYRFTK